MNDDLYYVVHCSENLDVVLYRFTKEQLQAKLSGDEWTGLIVYTDESETFNPTNLHGTPGLYIFKGQLVVPKPKTVWEV